MISPDNTESYFGSKSSHNAWISEAIWGHRLKAQPPSVLMLEFLGMAEGMHREGKLLAPTRPGENAEYVASQSLHLRNILFNNPRMEEILRNSQGSEDDAWASWLKAMEQGASLGDSVPADFSYLRDRFDTFTELVSIVRLLRNITMDPGADRGWTTQFIFPIGPAALYEALGEKGDGFERNHVLFTRTGELAYLMLTRASQPVRDRIRKGLAPLFDTNSARNRLVMRLIKPAVPDLGDRKGGTYLPYKSHPSFERMAEDVAAILNLKLPDQDALQYLQPLLGLHLYLYGIETAHAWLDQSGLPPIICEVLAPKSDLVRKAAVRSYLENENLGRRAVRRFIDRVGFSDTELQRRLEDPSLDQQAKTEYLAEHLGRTLSRKKSDTGGADPAVLAQNFRSTADQDYRDGTGDALRTLASGCGLISRRGTNRYRYAPTDSLLSALVLANVTSPIEESVFLRRIQERYSMVVAPAEAKAAMLDSQFDKAEFQKNRERFTQHLIGMGLAHRMSDSCTYVVNPMESRE